MMRKQLVKHTGECFEYGHPELCMNFNSLSYFTSIHCDKTFFIGAMILILMTDFMCYVVFLTTLVLFY